MNWEELTESQRNILIAEIIFGAEIEWVKEFGYNTPYSKNKNISLEHCPTCDYDGRWGGEKGIPHYSTDIGIAWWVVKEMKNKEEKVAQLFKERIEKFSIFDLTADLICKIALETVSESK